MAPSDASGGPDSGRGPQAAIRGGINMFRRKRTPKDFAEEIQSHIELEADQLQQEGLTEGQARSQARRKFGTSAKKPAAMFAMPSVPRQGSPPLMVMTPSGLKNEATDVGRPLFQASV